MSFDSPKSPSPSPLDLQAVWQAGENQRQVELLNDYKGLPICHPAALVGFDPEQAGFRVHPLQSVCLKMQGYTFIRSRYLPQALKASLVETCDAESLVRLGNFEYANPAIGRRESLRVDLSSNTPINVSLYARLDTGRLRQLALSKRPTGALAGYPPPSASPTVAAPGSNTRLAGRLIDLSIHGIGVEVLAANTSGLEAFTENTPVTAFLQLPAPPRPGSAPPQFTDLSLPGKVCYLEMGRYWKYKIGVQIFPEAPVQALIQEYIQSRQVEILYELELIRAALEDPFPASAQLA
jgi:hypothetical protein